MNSLTLTVGAAAPRRLRDLFAELAGFAVLLAEAPARMALLQHYVALSDADLEARGMTRADIVARVYEGPIAG